MRTRRGGRHRNGGHRAAETDRSKVACDRHLVASAVAESARRSVCRNSGRESERAISADSGVFSGSVAKSSANLFSQRYAHNKLICKCQVSRISLI